MHKIDDLDRQLLNALQNDCRNLQEIADKLDTPISTLHYRVKRLEKEGIIKGYSVVLDSTKLGLNFNTVVHVSVKHGPSFEDMGKQIAAIAGVWAVYWAFGEVDYFVLTKAKTREEFNTIVRRIMNLDGVERTNSHVIANVIKESTYLDL
jgi:DNA-binding Lrp family transcriptional regulator